MIGLISKTSFAQGLKGERQVKWYTFFTCCTLIRATGCPDTDCWMGTGDTGLMKTMPLCCSVLPHSGVWGAAKLFPGLEPEIRPRFCRVKLRMAGLGR